MVHGVELESPLPGRLPVRLKTPERRRRRDDLATDLQDNAARHRIQEASCEVAVDLLPPRRLRTPQAQHCQKEPGSTASGVTRGLPARTKTSLKEKRKPVRPS